MTHGRWFADVERADVISLGMLEPIGPVTWQRLYHSFSSAVALLKADRRELAAAGLNEFQIEVLANRPTNTAAIERLLDSKHIQLCTIDDDSYPTILKEISDPPLWLYARGDLGSLNQSTLAVVGSRKPTSYALQAVGYLLSDTLVRSVTIASGLAYGIDKAAHARTLEQGGTTAAVLAGGLDSIYPADHTRLAEEIIKSGGLLLSEYPPLSRPRPYRFPVRNRILAGISQATLVIEARLKSGSLTTAKSAIDYNRDLFAVPGDITRPQAEGTNFLIKKGAELVDDVAQLETYFGLSNQKQSGALVDKELKKILDLLADTSLTVDQLVQLTKQPIETVLGSVTQLEILGLLHQAHDGSYQKTK